MTQQIKIRAATRSDLEDLARLNTLFNDSVETAEQLEDRWANPLCPEIPIVAEIGDRIVGFAGLRVVPYLFCEGAHAELTELFVEQGYRRGGVGSALVAYAESLAKERGAGELILQTGRDNPAGRVFYTAMGYEEWDIIVGKFLV
jgi:GNAT superfamily N-acetyltransferase